MTTPIAELTMTGKEYIETQMRLIELGRMMQSLPLDAFIKCITNAEVTTSSMDPVLFRKVSSNMGAIKKLALAAAAYQVAFESATQVITQTQIKD